MIKLFSLKQQKKDGDATAERGKKASAAQLRIHKGKSLWLQMNASLDRFGQKYFMY